MIDFERLLQWTARWGACLAAVLFTVSATEAQPALHVLLDNGPTSERINIVILGDGYTAGEQEDFVADAQDFLDVTMATPPYAEYGAFFNAFAISAISAESGSDHPAQGVYRDTYFHSHYDCQNVQRLICLESEGGERALTALQDLMPEYDIVVLLVNDLTYGGAGGPISVASVHPLAADIALHELGHSLASMDDEYPGAYVGGLDHNIWEGPEYPEYDYSTVKWLYWIEPSTPLPTPNHPAYQGEVGAFEFLDNFNQTLHRPEFTCKMRSLSSDFCAVCYERHVGAIYQLVRPITSREPAASEVGIPDGTIASFSVGTLIPEEWTAVEWYLNGVPFPGAQGATFELPAWDLEEGDNLVEARVADTNELVRAPGLLPLLRDSTAWTVVRTEPVATEPTAAPVAQLLDSHPNPMRGMTTFAFSLPTPGAVRLVVYDVVGREVATVVESTWAAGTHEVRWEAPGLAPGVYVYRFDAPGLTTSRRLTVLR